MFFKSAEAAKKASAKIKADLKEVDDEDFINVLDDDGATIDFRAKDFLRIETRVADF